MVLVGMTFAESLEGSGRDLFFFFFASGLSASDLSQPTVDEQLGAGDEAGLSEARNSTALAISSGWAIRPAGIRLASESFVPRPASPPPNR